VEETSSVPEAFRTSLATRDFSCRIAMHGEENSALLQAAFISLCFEFRDTRADHSGIQGNNRNTPPALSPKS